MTGHFPPNSDDPVPLDETGPFDSVHNPARTVRLLPQQAPTVVFGAAMLAGVYLFLSAGKSVLDEALNWGGLGDIIQRVRLHATGSEETIYEMDSLFHGEDRALIHLPGPITRIEAGTPLSRVQFTLFFNYKPAIGAPFSVRGLEARAFGDDQSYREGPLPLASQAQSLSLRPIIESKPYAFWLLHETPHYLTITNPKTKEKSIVVLLYWREEAKRPEFKLGFMPEDVFVRNFARP